MSNIAKTIGERLRNYRAQAGLSQETLAENAGVHPTYIGQVERGEKNATLESIEKIARALNLPLETLFANIISTENLNNNTALECYDLILKQEPKVQENILEIIKRVIG